MTSARTLALGATLLLASGCYTYVPAELSAVAPGEPVRVEMSREAMAQMLRSEESQVAHVGPLLRGTLTRRAPDEILVRVPVGNRLGQDVRIPAGEVLRVGKRRVSWAGTALTVGAGAGLAAFVVHYIMDGAVAVGRPPVEEPDNLRVR